MTKSLSFLLATCLFLVMLSCKNKTENTGMQPDSTLVTPPQAKAQDTSTSLTDTSYRIGDTVR